MLASHRFRPSLVFMSFSLLLAVLFPLALAMDPLDRGLMCADHPSPDAPAKSGVLLRDFQFVNARIITDKIFYLAREATVRYSPVSNPTDTRYHNLDLFYLPTAERGAGSDEAVAVYFQRPAKVYLFLNTIKASTQTVGSLPGWTPEGWAKMAGPTSRLDIGIHQKAVLALPATSYVFSMETTGTDNVVMLPHSSWIRSSVSGVRTRGKYHVRIAEADGSPVAPPPPFKGVTVTPNEPCPAALHDSWGTFDDNLEDQDTKGKLFGSWHPQWDPCYWCAYDHEHGSSAPRLMNYKPKYGLTEFKNGGGIETNQGFKDFVIEHEGLYIYLSMHARTSSLRRVTTRFHTITVVVKSKATGELLMEVTTKGDFGFLAVRKRGGGIVPADATQAAIQAEQRKYPTENGFRAINIIDKDNLNPEWKYASPDILKGLYEPWSTDILCTTASRFNKFAVDFILPSTASKTPAGLESVPLGVRQRKGIMRNNGIKRDIRFRKVIVGAQYCGREAGFTGGYFYTDVYGKESRSGPGPDAVRQYIKPGFSATIMGKFEPTGQWLGKYIEGKHDFLRDIGYGVDPDSN